MKKLLYLIFFTLGTLVNIYGQNNLILERKTNPKNHKKIDFNKMYTIKTTDTIYYSKIINFTDTSIFINHCYKTNYKQDSTYIKDTLQILFSNIEYLKKDWFTNKKWLKPFNKIGLYAVLGIAIFPFILLNTGTEDLKEWAIIDSFLFGISFPVIFIGNGQTKYDLKNKWTIKTK